MTTAQGTAPPAETDTLEGLLAQIDALAASDDDDDGIAFEHLVAAAAPHVAEWDIAECWRWRDWPGRPAGTTLEAESIDLVARRRSDGAMVAIECKKRRLDAAGAGADIRKGEASRFVAEAGKGSWAERWFVTNGAVAFAANAKTMLRLGGHDDIRLVNAAADLRSQIDAHADDDTIGEGGQSRSAMQDEAVAESVRILRDHAGSASGGGPRGQARGKIILPCGTGKTRISLRIVEELTHPDQVSVVLCPSIALVAQLRREYMQHRTRDLRALAVCSDKTAGHDPDREEDRDLSKDPTLDTGSVAASAVKGQVTTDPTEIADWIRSAGPPDGLNVIFGTYQSAGRISQALTDTNTTVQVLVCDEAHRTAGIRRARRSATTDQRLREFVACHDQGLFPARYRVYQTATPKLYDPAPARAAGGGGSATGWSGRWTTRPPSGWTCTAAATPTRSTTDGSATTGSSRWQSATRPPTTPLLPWPGSRSRPTPTLAATAPRRRWTTSAASGSLWPCPAAPTATPATHRSCRRP